MVRDDLANHVGGSLGFVAFGHEGIIRDGLITIRSMPDEKPTTLDYGEARPLPFWKRPLSWRQVMLLAVPMFLLACLLLVLAGAIAIGCLSAMGPSPGI
ncbi:MAG TPA: hypothetical protein VIM11_08275 [Tepidisphaeraceae bacterium]